MKTKFQTIILSGVAAIATVAVFSLSIKDSSLESLRANAATKCVVSAGSDCQSSATGNIYVGYKKGTVGTPTGFTDLSQ